MAKALNSRISGKTEARRLFDLRKREQGRISKVSTAPPQRQTRQKGKLNGYQQPITLGLS